MASLDDDSVGIKLLAGLPEGSGLPPIAAELLDNPRPVFALVEYRVKREVTDLETGGHGIVLRHVQIEPLTGAAADRVADQLRKVREKRTGVVPLPGVDGDVEVPPADEGPTDGGSPPPPGDLPSGPEWGDGQGGAAEPPAEAEPIAAEAGAPPFTQPTPLGQRRPRKA